MGKVFFLRKRLQNLAPLNAEHLNALPRLQLQNLGSALPFGTVLVQQRPLCPLHNERESSLLTGEGGCLLQCASFWDTGIPDLWAPIVVFKQVQDSIQNSEGEEHIAYVDIQDAYMHVPIYPPHQRFLLVAVAENHFQFVALLFCLSSAPRMFIKVLAPFP